MARYDEYDEDRVVVIERENGTMGIGTFLLGLAIGAGAALLFAPASGAETRQRLQDDARRAGRKVKDMTDAFGDTMADSVEKARDQFDEQVGRARDAVNARVQAVGDAVAVGREAAAQSRADLERAVADSKRAYADSRRAYREHSRRQGPDHASAPDDMVSSSGEESAGAPGEG
ncbi:YtxH domain-containing protein [Gemmatimonas sp.]|jgi:gas vesicle protein|uniref:YtxH domain-containing protein n=1 Tax=Gemmatimonas sp. TaxID=1962908 RepID=UPI0037BF8234